MSTLTERLTAFRESLLDRVSPEDAHALAHAEEVLLASDASARIRQPGEMAPDFTLPDQAGRPVHLTERLRDGPVALVFVRGGWCPYCTLTLRAWQDALPALRRAGGQILAVTPQRCTNCSDTVERDMLRYPLLSDEGNRVAALYGAMHEIDPALRPFYLRIGHDLPRINGTGDWHVPLPATFVVASDGTVALSHAGPLVHSRLEPSEAVEAVRRLAGRG